MAALRPPTMRRLHGDTRGAAALEFAILLPLFVALIFGVMQLGQALWTQSALQHAVEMAARCASVNTVVCGTATQVQAYAATQAYGLALPAATFSVATPACGNEVTANYALTLPVATPINTAITLNARACYPR